jgi:hypothetical protein
MPYKKFVFQKISVSLQALSREDREVTIIELITNLKQLQNGS